MNFFITKKLIPYFGKMPIADITENTVNAYLSTIVGKRTVSDDIKYLKMIFRYAYYEGISKKIFKIRNPDPACNAGKYIEKETVYKLLNNCFHNDEKLQILMAYEMGMRRGEICMCRWEFINLREGIIKLPAWFLKTRRTNDRIVPITINVLKILKSYKDNGIYLFPSPVNVGESIKNNKSSWIRLKKRCGVRLRFHDLRHTCITNLVMANVHVLTIRQMCGVSPQVMRRYTHVPVEEMKECMQRALRKAA